MWISVDAVISPLSVEYTTVVVKVMVVLSSAEQVASDSSKSEEVKLQEHISWIVFAMLALSIRLVCFWKICFQSTHIQKTIVIAIQISYLLLLTFKFSH